MKTGLLTSSDIKKLISDRKLTIVPLLESDQIGGISVDLRIGIDFLSQHQGREPFIDTTNDNITNRPIKSHFTETRRKLGENFLLHPSQPVLFSTLEYIKLPNDVFVDLSLRSSYNRLGLNISAIVQPGYCGCISVEVVNSGNTPIRIMSGARFLQARFYKLHKSVDYFNIKRKYTCQVRPVASKANEDEDLKKISSLFNF
ncbi:dCTP deaminase [Salinimicrobium sp. TIG7-5_MAKvit]|uniref:dCTP deaminase n=1 Tax=Salinimicrobium sp. TIG7-5_MAKvit TaxID=3121289 RepID=UPI003C6E1FC0